MKKVLQVLAVMLLPLLGFAHNDPGEGVLNGTLTDKNTGQPIPGAVITIENSYAYSVTDAQGYFSFTHLEIKNITIHVDHIAYQKFTSTIAVPATDVKLALQPRSFMADEVIVTATRAGNKSAMAYTNVNKEEIEKVNLGQDLPYLINLTPSVVTTSDAGTGIGYTGIRIRGSDATRVNVTINGIPVNDAEEHAVYWVDLPDFASSVDNIQIQRGIGTSTNGAGAFGGSVNIQSSSVSPLPFAEISSSYGSFNSWKNTVSFGSGLLNNKFAIDGRLSKITSDGYIDRATSDLKSFYLSGGYYGHNSTLRAVIFSGKEKTYQSWYGVPEDSLASHRTYNPAGEYYDYNGQLQHYANQTDNYQQDYYQLLYSYSGSPNLNVNAALHYTQGEGYYEEYMPQQSFESYKLNTPIFGTDTIKQTDLIRQRWGPVSDFYGFTCSVNYNINNLKLTWGGAGNRYTAQHYDEVIWGQNLGNSTYPWVYQVSNDAKNDYNTFLKGVYSIKHNLHVSGDLQYRNINYSFYGSDYSANNVPPKVNLNFFNPKGGITYDLNDRSNIYVSVAVGHKEPSRSDYLDFVAPQRPLPEQMTDWEAGYKFSGNKLRVGCNLYFMNYKDQLILTGKLNNDGLPIRMNTPDSYREGAELEFAWSILKTLTFSANATLSRNKIKTFDESLYDENYIQYTYAFNNSDIAFSPSVISAAVIAWSPLKNLSAELTSKYVGKQYLDNTSDETRKLDPYLVNNLLLNYHIHLPFLKDIELKFAINNLLDKKYESNGATYPGYYGGVLYNYNYYYPQAGRNYFGGISIKF